MTRPKRRTSGLAGASPVNPAAEPAAAPAAEPAKTDKPKSKYPPKVSFYQDPEDTARVRGTLRGMMIHPGAATNMSQFIHRAVMEKVERLEAEYNDGKPFMPAQAGDAPRGRPAGE